MAADDDMPLEGLHHAKAAGVVRAAETVLALAELEFEEREGKKRPSVLEAVGERAAELAAELGVEQRREQLAAVLDAVGESAALVITALKGTGEAPAGAPSTATEPEPPAKSKPSNPSKPSKPNRPLIGPQVRVRAGEGAELVPSTQLWSGTRRKDRRR